MDSLEKAHQYLRHTRIAIWAIILFLGVVVYLMVTLSQQVSNEEAMDFRSRASEYYGSNQVQIDGQDGGNTSITSNSNSCNQACASLTSRQACLRCRCGWYECPNNTGTPTVKGCNNPGDFARMCPESISPTPTPLPTEPPEAPIAGTASDNTGCNAILEQAIRPGPACATGIKVRCVRNNGVPFGSCSLYAGGWRNVNACLKGTQVCSPGTYCEGQFLSSGGEDLMVKAKAMCCGGSNGDQPKCSFF